MSLIKALKVSQMKAKAQIKQLIKEARISELEQIKPPEQYKEYAKLAGRESCVICGFNSEVFREHIEERLAALQGQPQPEE